MMLPIEAHRLNGVDCYFIENNKAVSIDNQEMICWDISDMKHWDKIFQVQSENIKCILDSNHKL